MVATGETRGKKKSQATATDPEGADQQWDRLPARLSEMIGKMPVPPAIPSAQEIASLRSQ